MKKLLANALLAVASFAAGISIVFAADRIVGWLHRGDKVQLALLFPPNSDIEYDTMEFNYKVHTNNLGFRGNDTTLHKARQTRVVALGDSFTYGWGANLEDTWVHQLESRQLASGRDIEILNLGVPGAWPGQYADRAEELVPILKPDVVLVGLLQGDDLEQSDETHLKEASGTAGTAATFTGVAQVRSLSVRLFPNLTGAAQRDQSRIAERLGARSTERWQNLNAEWKREAREYIAGLSETQLEAFHRMSERVQQAFLDGRLNPSNLKWMLPKSLPPQNAGSAAQTPQDDPTKRALMQQRIEICARQIERIRKVAESCGARVVVVSIPEKKFVVLNGWWHDALPYVTDAVKQEWLQNLKSPVPDQAASEVCERAGVPLIVVTEEFRARTQGDENYYPYDAHFTPAGNRLFAELLSPKLEAFLK